MRAPILMNRPNKNEVKVSPSFKVVFTNFDELVFS